jgi:hypothetical protein
MVELARLMKGYLNESKDDMKVSGWENGLEAALKKLKK